MGKRANGFKDVGLRLHACGLCEQYARKACLACAAHEMALGQERGGGAILCHFGSRLARREDLHGRCTCLSRKLRVLLKTGHRKSLHQVRSGHQAIKQPVHKQTGTMGDTATNYYDLHIKGGSTCPEAVPFASTLISSYYRYV